MIAKKRSLYFNVTGLCVPGKHYMVDTSAKIDTILRNYVERGEYFTINRSRQFGKTTTLNLLKIGMAKDYTVINISLEGRDDYFTSIEAFVSKFCNLMQNILSPDFPAIGEVWKLVVDEAVDLDSLRLKLSETCELSPKPVVLLIDEVDRASDFQVFSAFLGLLRDMYLEREANNAPACQSVILAGVHDIKNLRKRIRSDSKHSYNSPWNIAADFTVDLSFSAPEISTMLNAYEQDHRTGMDITAISERLYYYTSGYPFLVSRLCKTIDETPLRWTVQGVDDASQQLLLQNNTLFDDLIKNIDSLPELHTLLEQMLLEGYEPAYEPSDPPINYGMMYGILVYRNNAVQISNVIFETKITNYFIARFDRRQIVESNIGQQALFIKDGLLDMETVCTRFAAFMRQEYRDEDGTFIEQHARLLFLAFLKPIINGTGHYAVEPQTRGSKRMDIVVFYKHHEYIVELKIWRGEQYEQQGIEQLANYLTSRDTTTGWLISFCDLQKQPRNGGILKIANCTINETIIAYRDKE